MPMKTTRDTTGIELTEAEDRRIQHQLEVLERRLEHHPEPSASLRLTGHPAQRQVEADLRVQLSPLGPHLVSRRAAETVDRALHLAVEDVERQLERRHAKQRGEPSFGVVSRRLPRERPPTP